MARINLRIDDSIKQEIDLISQETNKNISDTLRELIDIGIFVKKKQLANGDQKQDDWDGYFKKVALKTMESRLILQSIHKSIFNKELSKFDNPVDEIKDLMERAVIARDKDLGRISIEE